MRTTIRLGLLLILLTTVGAGCAGRHRSKQGLGEVERLPRLETVNPTLYSGKNKLKVEHSYTATVESLEKAELNSRVRGYIKEMPAKIDIGYKITKNEVLLTLDIPDVLADLENKKALLKQNENLRAQAEQAIVVAGAEVKETEAQLPRWKAEYDFRELEHTRISQLASRDTVARQRAEETDLQRQSASAAWMAAKAQIVTKNARWEAAKREKEVAEARVKVAEAEVARLQTQVDFATIKAPFDGVITKRWVHSGDTIKETTTPLLTVMRTDKMRVLIDVPERHAPLIRAGKDGNEVKLRIPALDAKSKDGPKELTGQVALRAAALDPVTRTMRTEIHLDNKAGELEPQMTGTATVILDERETYTVPSSALVRTGDRLEVYVVQPEAGGDSSRGKVIARRVILGRDDGRRVEIQKIFVGDTPGLPTGNELVILRGAGVIHPGEDAIAIRPGE